MKAPPPYAAIVFDCDSTLASIEGIEALAADRFDEIRELTDRAMNGELPLEDVYGARLETIQPTRDQVEAIGRAYVEHALPHARELVHALHALGKSVWVVSGGLAGPVRHLATHLGIGHERVFAVDVRHADDGSYAGFDETSPLARAGGKRDVLATIGRRVDDAPLALVGDGATDLEAAPLTARFVAFGGVERREAVFAAADVTCDAPDLAALLPLLTTAEEREALGAEHAALLTASPI